MELEMTLQKHFARFKFGTSVALAGERIGVFGPSGSGKSTLGNLIAGLLQPDSGSIRLDGRCLYDSAAGINLAPEQRRVGVVFQHAHLFPHLDVRRNLLYGYRRTPPEQRRLKLGEVSEALGLCDLFDRRVHALSGGEKQRVALGRALLSCPDLLILDEPLSALDQQLKEQIIPFLRKTLRRFAIPYLYISHALSEMRLLTDQVLQLAGGSLQQVTTAEDMAWDRMVAGRQGYRNHLQLTTPREVGSLLGYRWGSSELLLSDHPAPQDGLFELSSREILLFRKHPQALSARNLLQAKVLKLQPQGGLVGVVLDCGGEQLIAEVVREAALELELQPGQNVYAAVKASAFKRLA